MKISRVYQRLKQIFAAKDVPSEKPSVDKALIISNCQVQPLKHGLTAVCSDLEFEIFGVHLLSADDRDKTLKQFIDKKTEYRFILTIPLSSDYGPLSSGRIKESFAPTPVLSISNLHFGGLHPDITYVGGLHKRMPGPIGDYHSQIALLGYLMELPQSLTIKLYCDEVYQRMAFYEGFQQSLAEMSVRDINTDIPVGDWLEAAVRMRLAFLSHNHPTSFLMAGYINQIAKILSQRGLVSLSGVELQAEEMINHLAFSSIFPVYPEVARHHQLPYEGSYVYRTATIGDVPARAISLPVFIAGEYAAFSAADQDVLKTTFPGNILIARYATDPNFLSLIEQL